MASAPAHVSPTPAFGPGSTSVLRASRECVGRGCSRVAAGPQSRAPWCVLGRGSWDVKQPPAAPGPVRPRHTEKPLQGCPASPNPQSHRVWGFVGSPGVRFGSSSHFGRVPRSGVRGEAWGGGGVVATSPEMRMRPESATLTIHHSLDPWRPSEAGQVAAGSSGGQSGWAGPGYPPPSLPRL